MGQLRQGTQERTALDAAWQATREVVSFKAALREFIETQHLEFDKRGLDLTSFFAQRWLQDNGPLPDSGIWTG